MLDALDALISGVQTIIDFLSQIISAFLDLIGYIAEATNMALVLGTNLPAPVAVMLTAWVTIMIIYAIKGV